jgi:hypothetical protein
VGVGTGEIRSDKWEKIQFPIFHSLESYKAGKIRHVQGMRREAVEAIDRIKPYKGGENALWMLRQLDNTDKHNFIILPSENAIVGGIRLHTENPYFTSLGVPKQKQQVDFSREETLIESAIDGSNALLPTLHQLAELVSNIISSFRPFLE